MDTFDDLVETKISEDGKVTAKRYITDEESAAEMEMREAGEFRLVAHGSSKKLRREMEQHTVPRRLEFSGESHTILETKF